MPRALKRATSVQAYLGFASAPTAARKSRASGASRPGRAHSARPWMGRNAIHAAAGALVTLAGWLPDEVEVDGLVYRESLNAVGVSGGVAVQLALAVALTEPSVDVTWVFYDHEEVASDLNGLGCLARTRPELLAADFAVLCEPTAAQVEGGCNGTARVALRWTGRRAHSARSRTVSSASGNHSLRFAIASAPSRLGAKR